MSTNTPIASITLSSAQATIDFNSISNSYTDLVLIMQVTTSSGGNYTRIRFNSDTGSNYSVTRLSGNGTSTTSSRLSNQTYMEIDNASFVNTTIANRILQIQNYSNTTTFKTVLGRNNNSSNGTGATAGLWRSTSAITSISIFLESNGTFNSGSTFNLYGIASGSPKANGGNTVTTDGTYWYHTFTSSSVFTPAQNLTADYLVVAGGGGGGSWFGGGGGAGGYRYLTSQALTSSTNYTVTVGAGGVKRTNGSNSVFGSTTSTGGGYGGTRNGYTGAGPASNGGSGGGGAGDGGMPTGGTGTSGQGNNGGTGFENSWSSSGGGGGGSGAVGGNGGNNSGGSGGAGTSNSITGSAVTYAAGGSGGNGDGNVNANGSGQGANGTANTGNGAQGGGGNNNDANLGGTGGSGIVIVRYPV